MANLIRLRKTNHYGLGGSPHEGLHQERESVSNNTVPHNCDKRYSATRKATGNREPGTGNRQQTTGNRRNRSSLLLSNKTRPYRFTSQIKTL
ncbi:MAG: hypothetical protein F6K63_23930 [Moorea sp. SIO1G6]|uniref:hypothetical protein n=1 Tax=Moorena sp. SIO1G6 TaxID=2607840 RepID=UPI0013C06B59|nr:hypothetical protein [Moorena sp. SIO1G6]NET67269.1 hypothetical protein [Moorena sp. SIO1G6]